jgi:hypothetical protein
MSLETVGFVKELTYNVVRPLPENNHQIKPSPTHLIVTLNFKKAKKTYELV